MGNYNITWIITVLIKELGIPFSSQNVEQEIARQKSPHDLDTISDVLNHLGISNGVCTLSFKELVNF